jgi:coupling of ubiquitin conjugation to ER degradation protein 1
LIERYGLANRVPSRKGKEVDAGERPEAAGQDEGAGQNQASGGKANWADSREGREKVLRERKERMILEARR